MTTINTIEDLLRVLDERPEWNEALRSRMLSRELLNLPQAFAEFAERTERLLAVLETTLAEFVASTNQRLMSLEEGQARIEDDVATLKEGQARIEDDVATLKERQARIENDVVTLKEGQARIENDVATLKAAHARNGALRITRHIARVVNCRQVRLVEGGEILDWLDTPDSAGISPNELLSFENADIIIEATHRETGETHYIAVEASYTAGRRDTDRAIRNAAFLTRFTGQPAHAVIASQRVRPGIKPLIDNGEVHWAEIPQEELETE